MERRARRRALPDRAKLIPFASHPGFPYDWETEHGEELQSAGELARSLRIRLSMHPGQYINPASPKPETVKRSLNELRYVTRMFSLLDGRGAVVVPHMGGAYEDKPATVRRFVEVLRPEEETLGYLALENDERIWTVAEVTEAANSLGVPAITDILHHKLNPGGLALKEALDLSLPTWAVREARPKVHLSSQDPRKQPGAQAYSIDLADWRELVEALRDREADVMIEAKGKEQALAPLGVRVDRCI